MKRYCLFIIIILSFSCTPIQISIDIPSYFSIIEKDSKIYDVKYTPDSKAIIICQNVELPDKRLISKLLLFSLINFKKTDLFNPLSLSYINNNKIDFIEISELFILDEKLLTFHIWIGSGELNNDFDPHRIVYNYKEKIIISDEIIKMKDGFVRNDRLDKQSFANRNIFYTYGNTSEDWEIINFNGGKKEISQQNHYDIDEFVNIIRYPPSICDGFKDDTVVISILNKNDKENYFYECNYKKNVIVKKYNLPLYFKNYLKSNVFDVVLSKNKDLLLFTHFAYGIWLLKPKNNKIYEIVTTNYNWFTGFGNFQVSFKDWSWQDNNIIVIINDIIYQIDLSDLDNFTIIQ